MNTVEQIQTAAAEWAKEDAAFVSGNASAGTRARKHLTELMKLAKQRRVEIQEAKDALKAAKAA